MTNIIPELNSKIKTLLEDVTKIKAVYAYPVKKFTQYPAAVFYPSGIENNMETTRDNFKKYGFKLWIVINTNATDIETGYQIMARVLDAVIEKLDSEWDFSTIGGHRAWNQFNVGSWTVSEEQAGLEIAVDLDLICKILTNN